MNNDKIRKYVRVGAQVFIMVTTLTASVYLWVTHQAVPDALLGLDGMAVGFFLGDQPWKKDG